MIVGTWCLRLAWPMLVPGQRRQLSARRTECSEILCVILATERWNRASTQAEDLMHKARLPLWIIVGQVGERLRYFPGWHSCVARWSRERVLLEAAFVVCDAWIGAAGSRGRADFPRSCWHSAALRFWRLLLEAKREGYWTLSTRHQTRPNPPHQGRLEHGTVRRADEAVSIAQVAGRWENMLVDKGWKDGSMLSRQAQSHLHFLHAADLGPQLHSITTCKSLSSSTEKSLILELDVSKITRAATSGRTCRRGLPCKRRGAITAILTSTTGCMPLQAVRRRSSFLWPANCKSPREAVSTLASLCFLLVMSTP